MLGYLIKLKRKVASCYPDPELLQPLKLMRVLAGLEYANRPLSRLSPHIKVGSTVVVKHVKTGVKRTLNLVHPHQGSKNGYTLPCSSPLGMSLLGKKVGQVARYKEQQHQHSWRIINIKNETKDM